MDYLTDIIRLYDRPLKDLEGPVRLLERARGSEKREIEDVINQKAKAFFLMVKRDFPSRLIQTLALTALYQQASLFNAVVANALRTTWQRDVIRAQNSDVCRSELVSWNMGSLASACAEVDPALAPLPFGSWFLQFKFTLAKPYISHDDEESYLIDNPVTKDHVFGLPLIRPSSWKGNLRSTLRLCKGWKDEQAEIVRLFGNPKDAKDNFRRGYLECFPTFFYRIGLEIINPHNRARKVGKNPILIECVPADASGTFSLLYVPFDMIGKPEDEVKDRAKEDLKLIAEAVSAMMLTYGFSAKRTSGYGIAEDKIAGKIKTKADQKPTLLLSNLVQEVQDVQF